jgi:hypothetical protein
MIAEIIFFILLSCEGTESKKQFASGKYNSKETIHSAISVPAVKKFSEKVLLDCENGRS